MRTAIISDIHGNWAGLQVVLDHIEQAQVDRILCLGDLVDGGDENEAVIEFMRSNNIASVRGNHDEINNCQLSKKDQQWLNELPEDMIEDDVIFTHISPRQRRRKITTSIEAWNVFDETKYRLVFVGHNHFPALFSEKYDEYGDSLSHPVDNECHSLQPDDRYVVTVGAVGYPRGGGRFLRYGIFDSIAQTIEFCKVPGPLLPYGYP